MLKLLKNIFKRCQTREKIESHPSVALSIPPLSTDHPQCQWYAGKTPHNTTTVSYKCQFTTSGFLRCNQHCHKSSQQDNGDLGRFRL